MLMPRQLGGSFGARDGLFRVLLCRVGKPGWCGAVWTANDSHALGRHLLARETHEALCTHGAFDGVPAN